MLAAEPPEPCNQHRLAGGLADGGVVQSQLGHRGAIVKLEIVGDEIALPGCWIIRGHRGRFWCACKGGGKDCREHKGGAHRERAFF
jgi:hypothetical protein